MIDYTECGICCDTDGSFKAIHCGNDQANSLTNSGFGYSTWIAGHVTIGFLIPREIGLGANVARDNDDVFKIVLVGKTGDPLQVVGKVDVQS
ncbi:MAG: hypothetical protein F4X83_05200 [Chloroflexi bacterium]|nr:hypothetical protein [Chloroflexota bacterium]